MQELTEENNAPHVYYYEPTDYELAERVIALAGIEGYSYRVTSEALAANK